MSVVSTLHAILVTICSFTLVCMTSATLEYEEYTKWTNSTAVFTVSWSIGYFIYDILWMAWYRNDVNPEILSFFHHIIGILALFASLWLNLLVYFALFQLIAEFSTPFVNLRWMLSALDKKSKEIYKINGYVMMLSFFISRIASIPWLWYTIAHVLPTNSYQQNLSTIQTVTWLSFCVFINLLNLYWMFKMVHGAYKFLKGTDLPLIDNMDENIDTDIKENV